MCPQQPSSYAEVASLAEDCLCLNVVVPRAAGYPVGPCAIALRNSSAS